MSPVTALQRALAAEHAALHVYGTLGARTSASATPTLFTDVTAAYTSHRARRDQLTALLRDHGAEPVAAEAAYELPSPLDTPAQVTGAALDVEQSCTATYAWLVGQTSGADRRWAVTALTDTAVRELTFRGSPEIFPGRGEHTDR
ncbi:ferritin-like domain-containing protein [Nocardioides sp. GXQ0305]|uniref:ferritin-like domain-containing protein n=1 Tax=Nocardioides sp. GXQ0305 TaxID=3423912 RepID=UPI003D7E3DFE